MSSTDWDCDRKLLACPWHVTGKTSKAGKTSEIESAHGFWGRSTPKVLIVGWGDENLGRRMLA